MLTVKQMEDSTGQKIILVGGKNEKRIPFYDPSLVDKIRSHAQTEIDELRKQLGEFECFEDRCRDPNDFTLNSSGNEDDVFDDGAEAGNKSGRLEAFQEIINIIEESEKS